MLSNGTINSIFYFPNMRLIMYRWVTYGVYSRYVIQCFLFLLIFSSLGLRWAYAIVLCLLSVVCPQFTKNASPFSILIRFQFCLVCLKELGLVHQTGLRWASAIVLRLSSIHNSQEMLLPQFLSDLNSVWFVWKSSGLCNKLPHGFQKF